MKKVLLAIAAFATVLCGCTRINELSDKVDDLDERVSILEDLCQRANDNIDVLQQIAQAQAGYKFIESVTEITDGVKITFSDGYVCTVKNGEKGGKGDKGIQGDKGETGASPIVSIGVFEGVSYWKVNDEWILVDGKKVSAIGVTPQLRIENGRWQISYDSGNTWTDVAPAYDESTAITISQTDDEVTFTLHDGTKYVIAKVPGFKFKVSDVDAIAIMPGATKEIPYTISKGDNTVRFVIQAENYSVKVVPTDDSQGVVKVTAPDPIVDGWALITAVQNSTGESKAQYLEFVQGSAVVTAEAQIIPTLGGTVSVPVRSNIDYEVSIPEEAQEWLSIVKTKGFTESVVEFLAQPNYTCAQRNAVISLIPAQGETSTFVLTQEGEEIAPEFGVEAQAVVEKSFSADTTLIKVTGTVIWSLELSEGLTASKLSGAGPAEVIINIPENNTVSAKEYTVKVISSNETVDPKSYTITIKQAGAPDPNDYYAQFMAGKDIEVLGEKYNKSDFEVSPRLVKAYQMTNGNDIIADYSQKGILFLDYDPADGKEDVFVPTGHLKCQDVIIIGRYKNHQPKLKVGSYQIAPVKNGVVFKNVNIESTNWVFTTGNVTSPLSFYIEDCTISTTGDKMFADTKAPGFFKDIVINNSILKIDKALYGYSSAITAQSTMESFEKFYLTNTVVYSDNVIAYPTLAFYTASTNFVKTPNMDVNIDHCTFYNLQNNNLGLVGIISYTKLNFNYCVGEAPLSGKNSVLILMKEALSPKVTDSSVKGNYFNNSGTVTSLKWAFGYSTVTNSGVTQSGNNFPVGATPFASTDKANGYFPVNTGAVTNGAGASYDTKLWRTW